MGSLVSHLAWKGGERAILSGSVAVVVITIAAAAVVVLL